MIIDRPQMKQAAKNLMRIARVSPYQIGLVYILISFALSSFNATIETNFGATTYVPVSDAYLTLQTPTLFVSFISVLVALISMLLAAGFSIYCLGVRRGHKMPLSSLFDGFAMAGKIIVLEIVTGIFVALWTLLLVIPGIIAAYRYRFALYNILENPDLGVMEAIALSKKQTYGYKWQLFVLDLSFLGWLILDGFTLGFLGIWLIPYMTLTDIAFYDTICAEKGLAAGSSRRDDTPPPAEPWDRQ